ncbi:hypothetical protein SLEP1_g8426 [Rubroshorea leprosula]|uniref:Uncharacterized protein n=1 Tax=Rubroshorea leprosula TaxID=152421 RepID=A0AAV5IAP6_9ROSI|nr:hypothetical protein SLEP1_g8426 [Rubroshorea leprosula]
MDLVDQTKVTTIAAAMWDDVVGLEDQQRRHLQKLHAKGVLWKQPRDHGSAVVFRLSHEGEVSPDENCLFTALQRAMVPEIDARELRRRAVKLFVEDLGSAIEDERESINKVIRHMYSPDLRSGWRVHVVQEVKLLAKKEDRVALDSAIDALVQLGMQSGISTHQHPTCKKTTRWHGLNGDRDSDDVTR